MGSGRRGEESFEGGFREWNCFEEGGGGLVDVLEGGFFHVV